MDIIYFRLINQFSFENISTLTSSVVCSLVYIYNYVKSKCAVFTKHTSSYIPQCIARTLPTSIV